MAGAPIDSVPAAISLGKPSEASVQMVLEMAWKDHHATREQTWKALQFVATLGVGLFLLDLTHKSVVATTIAAVAVMLAAVLGARVTWHHRNVERRKFIHIFNCERWLGLHTDELIPLHMGKDIMEKKSEVVRDGAVALPARITLADFFKFTRHSTLLFIFCTHLLVMIFALAILVARCFA